MDLSNQNKNIITGIERLKDELHLQYTNELLEGLGCIESLESFGWQHQKFPMNLCRFICLTKTTRDQFENYIDLALKNEDGHYLDFDGDTLALYIFCKNNVRKVEGVEVITDSDFHTIEIWFDSMHFEQYVGSKECAYGEGDTIIVEARDYLLDHWYEVAKDFIMNNLNKANIEDEHIESLLK